MIVTQENFTKITNILDTQKVLFVDTETDGLDPYLGNRICGIGLGLSSGKTYYFPFRHLYPESANLSQGQLLTLIDVLNKVEIIIGYNIKFDLHMLMMEGFIPWDKTLIDVLVGVRLVEKERFPELGLKDTIERIFGSGSADYDIETKDKLKRQKWIKNFALAPIDVLGPYCEEDVKWTTKLYFYCLQSIKNTFQIRIWKLENNLTKTLLKMEWKGISIDTSYCEKALEKIRLRQNVLVKRIFSLAGQEFNLNSPSQVGAMFNSLGINSLEKTPKGKESWGEVALVQIDHPIAGFIHEHRSLEKMRNTYLEPNRTISTLHTTYCNWGTITGRLSSREPNLQNIPRFLISIADKTLSSDKEKEIQERIYSMVRASSGARTSVGGSSLSSWGFTGDEKFSDDQEDIISIRRLFIARPGYILVSFDYAQMEVRVFLSYLNNDEILRKMSEEGFDFHTEAAKIAFGVSEEHENFKFYRQLAKAVTFGIIYGIGIGRLSIQLDKTEEETREYRDKYFENIKGSQNFIRMVARRARERGYISNKYGRRYSPEKDREYVGVNYLIQGTSADIMSERMVEVDKFMPEIGGSILLQVHDELICELPINTLDKSVGKIKELLEYNSFNIPLKVDVAICSPSWAHKK